MFKILVIDDDFINRVVISRMLAKEDAYDVIDCNTAIEALELMGIYKEKEQYKIKGDHVDKFDLILSDIMMPQMDGFEFCEVVRSIEELNLLPIILITGANDEEFINKSFDKGANDYINKPIYYKELHARVKLAIDLKNESLIVREKETELLKTLSDLILREKAVNASRTGIAILNKEQRITWVNESFRKLTFLEDQDLIGRNWEEVLVVATSKKIANFDYSFINEKGYENIVSYNVEPVITTGGSATNFVIAIYDISEREKNKKNLMRDLKLATFVQKNSLPKDIYTNQIELEGYYKPVNHLGGDLYYWAEIGDNKYGVVIFDVMGHGVATALITMYLRASIADGFRDFSNLENFMNKMKIDMESLNRANEFYFDYYLTCIAMTIDLEEMRLDYINCGHPEGILIKGDELVGRLQVTSVPIGLLNGKANPKGISIADIDEIYLYTDGIRFSYEKDEKRIMELLIGNTWSEVSKNIDEMSAEDDVTMVHLRIKGK